MPANSRWDLIQRLKGQERHSQRGEGQLLFYTFFTIIDGK